MTTYYNRHKFHAALITHDRDKGRVLQIVSCLGDWPGEALTFGATQPLPEGPIRLEVPVKRAHQQFCWSRPAEVPQAIGRASMRLSPGPSSACWRMI